MSSESTAYAPDRITLRVDSWPNFALSFYKGQPNQAECSIDDVSVRILALSGYDYGKHLVQRVAQEVSLDAAQRLLIAKLCEVGAKFFADEQGSRLLCMHMRIALPREVFEGFMREVNKLDTSRIEAVLRDYPVLLQSYRDFLHCAHYHEKSEQSAPSGTLMDMLLPSAKSQKPTTSLSVPAATTPSESTQRVDELLGAFRASVQSLIGGLSRRQQRSVGEAALQLPHIRRAIVQRRQKAFVAAQNDVFFERNAKFVKMPSVATASVPRQVEEVSLPCTELVYEDKDVPLPAAWTVGRRDMMFPNAEIEPQKRPRSEDDEVAEEEPNDEAPAKRRRIVDPTPEESESTEGETMLPLDASERVHTGPPEVTGAFTRMDSMVAFLARSLLSHFRVAARDDADDVEDADDVVDEKKTHLATNQQIYAVLAKSMPRYRGNHRHAARYVQRMRMYELLTEHGRMGRVLRYRLRARRTRRWLRRTVATQCLVDLATYDATHPPPRNALPGWTLLQLRGELEEVEESLGRRLGPVVSAR